MNGSFLGSESTLLNFSLNMVIRFFWYFIRWQLLKADSDLLFWVFEENSYYAHNLRNRPFFWPNYRKSIHYLFQKLYLITGIESEQKKWLFQILKCCPKCYPKNMIIGSSGTLLFLRTFRFAMPRFAKLQSVN